MCGIAGLILSRARPGHTLDERVAAMVAALAHRGPDDRGQWCEAQGAGAIALGQSRLAIVDLSPAGGQPMLSACGRYVLVYNGEVYNSAELRAELEAPGGPGVAWRGHSDTETVLEAWARWGGPDTLEKLIGMFALAVWDRRERTLTLARDRFGIKPLYFAARDEAFLFGSELKALMAAGGWEQRIDRTALAAYLRFNYVPGAQSIFEGVEKLEPGCLVIRGPDGRTDRRRYWDYTRIAIDGIEDPAALDDAGAEQALDELVRDAVRRRMIADVPLGAFLSGGIDSSTVVAAMQAESTRPVRTFTMGFDVEGYDESAQAAAVAAHLGTEHTEMRVTPADALAVIPNLAEWYDEPFADSSQIPTYLVSALARRHVTVALSGDGGDELFAGYERHRWADTVWRRTGGLPRPLARGLGRAVRTAPPILWQALNSIAPDRWRVARPAEKARKLAEILEVPDRQALYRRLVSVFDDPGAIAPGAREPTGPVWDARLGAAMPGAMELAQLLDAITYLPDDILTKVDRASMAVGLEARVPLLDHRVAGFAARLPRHQRVRDGQGKWLLRRVLTRYLPPALFERPKMGFGIPVDRWLKGPLRDWAEDLLAPEALERDGYLRADPIRALWDRHLQGNGDWTTHLWTVLMFQAWRARWKI